MSIKATTVSIAITSLNRREDLRETLLQLQRLEPPPLEILVCLDGATDGSRDMLKEFPSVKVIEHSMPQGSIPSRDDLFRATRGDLIVSLDDDSFPEQRDFVLRLIDLADAHPEAGVFAFNEVRPADREDRISLLPARPCCIATYPNCAGAIRAALYAKAASYPRFFAHTYEEPDYCLQIYAAGYFVYYDPSVRIFHRYTHTLRDMAARHRLHARNELWSAVMRCPAPQVIPLVIYRILRQFLYAASKGPRWAIAEPVWWWDAALGLPTAIKHRVPVRWKTYISWLQLGRRPVFDLDALEALFPKPSPAIMTVSPSSEPNRPVVGASPMSELEKFDDSRHL